MCGDKSRHLKFNLNHPAYRSRYPTGKSATRMPPMHGHSDIRNLEQGVDGQHEIVPNTAAAFSG
jgi:hypothetical protein